MKLEAEYPRGLSRAVFRAQGVSERDAGIVTDVLVEANLRGHDCHGVVRIPGWVEGLEAGAINAHSAPRLLRETAGSALMDGDRGLGPVVAACACACAAGKASVPMAMESSLAARAPRLSSPLSAPMAMERVPVALEALPRAVD